MPLTYFYIDCAAILIVIVCLAGAMQNLHLNGVKEYIFSLFSVLIALSFYTASLVIEDFGLKVLIHELKFIGTAYFSVWFYNMYLTIFDLKKYATKKILALLMIVPTCAIILALTNDSHHLFRVATFPLNNQYGHFVGVESGKFFYIYIVYSYAVYIGVIGVILRAYIRTPKIYRQQIGFMLFASAVTVIANFISISSIFFVDFGDATLLFFTMSAVLQYLALIRFKPTVMIELSRNMAADEIKNPIIFFDYQNNLLDLNETASAVFKDYNFNNLAYFFKEIINIEVTEEFLEGQTEITIQLDSSYYTVNNRRLYDYNNIYSGDIVVFNDITELKIKENILESLVMEDYVTGLPNRYAYIKKLSEANVDQLPIAIVFIEMNQVLDVKPIDYLVIELADAISRLTSEESFFARLDSKSCVAILSHKDEAAVLEIMASTHADISYGVSVKTFARDNINLVAKKAFDNLQRRILLEDYEKISGGEIL